MLETTKLKPEFGNLIIHVLNKELDNLIYKANYFKSLYDPEYKDKHGYTTSEQYAKALEDVTDFRETYNLNLKHLENGNYEVWLEKWKVSIHLRTVAREFYQFAYNYDSNPYIYHKYMRACINVIKCIKDLFPVLGDQYSNRAFVMDCKLYYDSNDWI